ncbi:DUF7576 family protein [Haladaptatus sp.]|uniref:DUF7576 family protein n=1 Tax=Haladaptatus sp. TaxID=1973141 RepID=UPI003C6ED613
MSRNDRRGGLVSRETGISRETETKTETDICSYCGSIVETNEWHPVLANDDGSGFRIHAFCDKRCRALWGRINVPR